MGSFHKWFLLFLILVLPVFVAKQYRILRDKKGASYVVESDFYHANPYHPNDKQFTVMVTAHNVAPFIERCLDSVIKQNYPNYRIIVLDQASTDGTYEKAARFVSQHAKEIKIELFQRSSEGALFQTYYQMVKEAPDHEIIVHLPGGDWLSNEHMLATLNHIYRNQDVWLTYPQYVEYPSYKKGVLKALPKKHLHKRRVHRTPWASSPLKTFYAGILKQIEIEGEAVSLFADGEKALMLPMAEIGKSHVRFISEVLYVHTSTEDHQDELEMSHLGSDHTDVILFSERGGQALHFSLQALEHHLIGKKHITVFTEKQEELLPPAFENIPVIVSRGELKQQLLKIIKNDSVLFTTDADILHHPIHLNRCAHLLKQSKAYGCYFHLKAEGRELESSPPRFVDKGVYIWDIHRSKGAFHTPDGPHTVLYDSAQLIEDLQRMNFIDFASFMEARKTPSHSSRQGLLFCDAKHSEY